MRAARPRADLVARDHRAERHAAGDTFGRAENVRFDTPVFAREHFAGAAEAGLNLIEYQENSVFSAKLLKHRQEFRRRHNVTTNTFYRFDENRRHFVRLDLVAKSNLLQHIHALDATGSMLQLIRTTLAESIGHVMHAGNQRSELGAMG